MSLLSIAAQVLHIGSSDVKEVAAEANVIEATLKAGGAALPSLLPYEAPAEKMVVDLRNLIVKRDIADGEAVLSDLMAIVGLHQTATAVVKAAS